MVGSRPFPVGCLTLFNVAESELKEETRRTPTIKSRPRSTVTIGLDHFLDTTDPLQDLNTQLHTLLTKLTGRRQETSSPSQRTARVELLAFGPLNVEMEPSADVRERRAKR